MSASSASRVRWVKNLELGSDHESPGAPFRDLAEGILEFPGIALLDDLELHGQSARGGLDLLHRGLPAGAAAP